MNLATKASITTACERLPWWIAVTAFAAAVAGCDLAKPLDFSTPSNTLTVNNTLAWCDVTVTINGHATEFKSQSSMSFKATATTTVMLMATPNPGFFAVKWTGVTTMSGSSATYVMTTAFTQSVTACCPTSSSGSGC